MLASRCLARPFRRGDTPRYAALFEPNTISYAQVYPFVLCAQALERRHNVQIWFFRADRLETINFARFDRVILQLWWRDIKAMAHGAVLFKPDTSHLTTLPDLYEAGVTYLPLAWDSSDLQEKTDWVLVHPDKASDITREAFRPVQTDLETDRFIDDMEPLFI